MTGEISADLADWYTTNEGDAMTHDEYDAAEDADGERRLERELEDDHDRRVAMATGMADARERWFREWAERGLAPLGLAHGMAFDAGWDAALRAAEETSIEAVAREQLAYHAEKLQREVARLTAALRAAEELAVARRANRMPPDAVPAFGPDGEPIQYQGPRLPDHLQPPSAAPGLTDEQKEAWRDEVAQCVNLLLPLPTDWRWHNRSSISNCIDAIASAGLRMFHAAPVAPAARPLDEWDEDDGPALWWELPVTEPPYAGTPDDSDWPGYHTHWTPIPIPSNAESEARQ
jgi:hypothetical protein